MRSESNLCCRALLELLKHDIKPKDIMTRKAFENAIVTVMALGGSTNADYSPGPSTQNSDLGVKNEIRV